MRQITAIAIPIHKVRHEFASIETTAAQWTNESCSSVPLPFAQQVHGGCDCCPDLRQPR